MLRQRLTWAVLLFRHNVLSDSLGGNTRRFLQASSLLAKIDEVVDTHTHTHTQHTRSTHTAHISHTHTPHKKYTHTQHTHAHTHTSHRTAYIHIYQSSGKYAHLQVLFLVQKQLDKQSTRD